MEVCTAKASLITYDWVPDNSLPNPVNGVTSSGSLVYNTVSGDITSFSFTYGSEATDTFFIADWFYGTFQLNDGDLALNGYSTDKYFNPILTWNYTFLPQPDENEASQSFCSSIYGDWVQAPPVSNGQGAVPEPATVFSGALLLLPFGLSIARGIRKHREA